MATNSEYLRVGDYINLGNVKFEGYLAADGILNYDLVTRDMPTMYDDSIFCIHLQRQYAACTELNEFLELNDTTVMDPDDKHSTKYLNALKVSINNVIFLFV